MSEPILTPDRARFVLFPIKPEYMDVWNLYKATQAQVWAAEDIDFSTDKQEWSIDLSEKERHFLGLVLSFFANVDGIVMENIGSNFAEEVQVAEMRQMYAYQLYIESVHSETYSLMIDSVVANTIQKESMFNALQENESVKRLAEWGLKWMDRDSYPFRVRIVAFVIYEGFLFSAKFASIFWFKKRNLLPGICHANLLISRDEGVHEDFGILVHSKLQTPCDPKFISKMLGEAFEIECKFFKEALKEDMIGMNYGMMVDYLKLVADRILKRFGCPPEYHGKPNALSDMMETIGMENKVSFFEHRNHAYQKAGVSIGSKSTFSVDEEF